MPRLLTCVGFRCFLHMLVTLGIGSMHKQTRGPLVVPFSYEGYLIDEVPPAVVAARRALGWSEKEATSAGKAPNDRLVAKGGGRAACPRTPTPMTGSRTPCPGTPVPQTPQPCLDKEVLVTAAGEVLKRRRKNGPWQPETLCKRGSAELACRIAEDAEERRLALRQFSSLKYAPTTIDTKDSLFGLWDKVCSRLRVDSLPLTEAKINDVTAILRASGYRAACSYVYEAKSRHVRAGYEWNDQLQMALTDAKRAAKRALGPPTRAEEVKLDWWAKFSVKHGKEPSEIAIDDDEPAGGLRIWVLATKFLLRETELASLTIDEEGVKIDTMQMTIGLHLSVQKNDPSAKGTWRALACSCGKTHPSICPYHTGLDLLKLQLKRVGMRRQSEAQGLGIPLVGQVKTPKATVAKDKMISQVKKLCTLMQSSVKEAKEIEIDRVTGHFARRSGAKDLARQGMPLTAIQWMARHSSNVTLQYVEDAWAEAPRADLRLQDISNLCEMANATLARVEEVETAVQDTEEWLKSQLEKISPTEWVGPSRAELRREIRAAMIPVAIINHQSGKIHTVAAASCTDNDVRRWTTSCGWPWRESAIHCTQVFEGDEVEETLERCKKCISEGAM